MNEDQYNKAKSGAGFIAALDQSGGSTPKALKLYGIEENAYSDEPKCSTWCTRCAPASSPALPSTATASWAPSCSR